MARATTDGNSPHQFIGVNMRGMPNNTNQRKLLHISRATASAGSGDRRQNNYSLPLWVRMKQLVAHQPLTYAAIAESLGAKVDSVEKAARRKRTVFTRVDGDDGVARIALLERRPE